MWMKFSNWMMIAGTLVIGWADPQIPAADAASTYRFDLITDTTGEFDGLGRMPAINNAGQVAFTAGLTDVFGTGLFRGAGGAITTIGLSHDAGPFNAFVQHSISDTGTVAFSAWVTGGTRGIFTGAGGQITTIATTDDSQFSTFGGASINGANTVAFAAVRVAGGQGIYTGSGGPTTPIAEHAIDTFLNPMINDSGTVVFHSRAGALPGPFTFTIRTGAGGPLTTVAFTGSGSEFSLLGLNPSINNAGTVAFVSGTRMLTASGGSFTTIANASDGPFSFNNSRGPAINDAGEVAFMSGVTPPSGIFLGPDAVNDAVIRTGDMLFGSTVTALDFSPNGFNDNGALAFWARLSDGRQAIVRATIVPEPTTVGLPLVGLLALVYRRNRARNPWGREHAPHRAGASCPRSRQR